MAGSNRMPMFSNASVTNSAAQQSTWVSEATLLNALHTTYTSDQPYRLDASTSLVMNTWLTATKIDQDGRTGGTVDASLAARAWEHAWRRAEDGCIVLGSLHKSTPSILNPFLSTLPLSIPSSLYIALNALRPFIHSVSPQNHSTPRHSALGVSLTISFAGNLTAASLALSQGGIDTSKGLLNIPAEAGYRGFDVFYYLLTSASTLAEREFLGLKHASTYALLAKSGTYDLPSYLSTADEAAAMDDFWAALKQIGITEAAYRDLIFVLAGLLKLGDTLSSTLEKEALEEICEEVGRLLGLEPEVLVHQCTRNKRKSLICDLYGALVDWVILKANETIAYEMLRIRDCENTMEGHTGARTPNTDEDNSDTVCIMLLEIPGQVLGKAIAMRGIFDDTQGINAEMKEDGVDVVTASSLVLRELENAIAEAAPDLGITTGLAGRERELERNRCEAVLEMVGREGEEDGFLKKILFPVTGESVNLGRANRIDLAAVIGNSRVWYHLSLHPNDALPASLASLPPTTLVWSAGSVSRQIRAWRLPEWSNRRNKNLDFTADFDHEEFCSRYGPLGCKDGIDGIKSWILERRWNHGEVFIGKERIWMRECAWWEAESMLDLNPDSRGTLGATDKIEIGNTRLAPIPGTTGSRARCSTAAESGDNYLLANIHSLDRSNSPTMYFKGEMNHNSVDRGGMAEDIEGHLVRPKRTMSRNRRIWLVLTWSLTFWIPSFILRYIGRMKRPEVRIAWREKITIFVLISALNTAMTFTMIQVGNYALLAFTILFGSIRVVKTFTTLVGGESGTKSRRPPAHQDSFVICLVPVYTEGEHQLRRTIDSLAALQYDNKRKLIFIICDGVVFGSRNDRSTPKIVLDILGVDPRIDPAALPFRSVGRGKEQYNYGNVHSGLYEYENNVVPYIVVVKVGTGKEQSPKPGNRGKRDSQVMLLSFLSRVHSSSPMSPLELEMFHQINNVIGIDPELYEYLFMVDADTSVHEYSLTRLVERCSEDSAVAGICGEIRMENEERTWWTMIQVYEYYASFHSTKTFESAFGSVTCLPGCFCMYRLRTAQTGRKLIISDKIIQEYSDGYLDTLHKKNLVSLGEDRYLTTLMLKHFPNMTYKFNPVAYASTTGSESQLAFYSQRRRWTNSTIHNLAEIVTRKNLCGFLCFDMRIIVFADLFGTIILPATAVSLGYLIYKVATHSGLPATISLSLVGGSYAFTALALIYKRRWEQIAWMIIYLMAFPIYSVLLPIYCFWNQDNFSWGNTQTFHGEEGKKEAANPDDDEFDPSCIPLQPWDDYATENRLPGCRQHNLGGFQGDYGGSHEMEQPISSIRPASIIIPPQRPAPVASPQSARQDAMDNAPPIHPKFTGGISVTPSSETIPSSMPPRRRPSSTQSHPDRTLATDFQTATGSVSEAMIIEAVRGCLAEVDLEMVTKKQVCALVEQRLQTELVGTGRSFLNRQIDRELANM